MTDYCIRCLAPLTSLERHYFYCTCESCERDRLAATEQADNRIKSPFYVLRVVRFYLRRFWFRHVHTRQQH